MHKQPLLILCISFSLGIALQDFAEFRAATVYALLVIGFISLSSFFLNHFYLRTLRQASLIFLFFTLGIFAHATNSDKTDFPHVLGTAEAVFKLSRKLNSNEKNRRYEIEIWQDSVKFKSVLSVPKEQPELDFRHYYKTELYISRLEKPYNDFQFDYAKYMSRQQIFFRAFASNQIAAAERDDLAFAEKIRQKRLEILRNIDAQAYSKRAREFTKGIILADRTEMDAGTVQDFSKSGLTHILAISGSHMAVIFWLILLVLNPIFPPRFRNVKIIISLVLIWSFAIFIGYGSSVVRSCIMISAYYCYVLLQRKPDFLHAMALAAFIILIYDSHQLYDVGFQLSFLAVFGIFWFNKPVLRYLPNPKNDFQNTLVNVVSISFAAQVATLPLVIYYFHQYSFISLPANLLIIPFSQILIVFSLLMTFLAAFGVNSNWLATVFDAFVNTTLKIIHHFAEVDFAFNTMIPMSFPEVVVALVCVYLLRFVIVKFSIQNILRLIYFLLIFVSLRVLLNYKSSQINEILEHRYLKENIISVKTGKHVLFIMSNNADREKVQKYVMEPYLTSRRTQSYIIKILPAEVKKVTIGDRTYHFERKR